MSTNATTTILVAALSGGGGVLVVREVIGVIVKIGRGVSGKISTRRADVIEERDQARDETAAAEANADRWHRNWQRQYTYSGMLEHLLAQSGIQQPAAQPVFEDTITVAQLRQIRGEKTP